MDKEELKQLLIDNLSVSITETNWGEGIEVSISFDNIEISSDYISKSSLKGETGWSSSSSC